MGSLGQRETFQRSAGQTVGELELISPELCRVATVRAGGEVLVGRLPQEEFTALAGRFPILWRWLGQELVRRVVERMG